VEEELKSEDGESLESEYDEEEEKDMQELEQEAKMLRDESISESDEEADQGKEEEGENTEFLTGGEDLDLPSELSESDADLKGPEDTDSELENYYEEIGIADEEDFTKPQEALYKTKEKPQKQQAKAEPEKSKKSVMIDQLIEAAKTEPTYNNVSRIIKLVK